MIIQYLSTLSRWNFIFSDTLHRKIWMSEHKDSRTRTKYVMPVGGVAVNIVQADGYTESTNLTKRNLEYFEPDVLPADDNNKTQRVPFVF